MSDLRKHWAEGRFTHDPRKIWTSEELREAREAMDPDERAVGDFCAAEIGEGRWRRERFGTLPIGVDQIGTVLWVDGEPIRDVVERLRAGLPELPPGVSIPTVPGATPDPPATPPPPR